MLCHECTKNYNKKFKTMLTNKIITFDALLQNIMAGAATEDKMPTDKDLEDSLNYNHTNAQAKGILYLLETGLRDHGKNVTTVLPLDSYELEHIMPKDWKQHWSLTDSESTTENINNRTNHIGFLGNKTLLAPGLNKSIKNKSFEVKKTQYERYAMGLKTFHFSNYNKWDEFTIDDRQNTLIKQIKTVWPYKSVR